MEKYGDSFTFFGKRNCFVRIAPKEPLMVYD